MRDKTPIGSETPQVQRECQKRVSREDGDGEDSDETRSG